MIRLIFKKLRYLYLKKRYKLISLLLGVLSYIVAIYFFYKTITSQISFQIILWQFFFFIFIIIGFVSFIYYFLIDQLIYQKKTIITLMNLLTNDEKIIFKIVYNKRSIFEEDLIKLSPLNKIRTLRAIKMLVRRNILLRIPFGEKHLIKIKFKRNL